MGRRWLVPVSVTPFVLAILWYATSFYFDIGGWWVVYYCVASGIILGFLTLGWLEVFHNVIFPLTNPLYFL